MGAQHRALPVAAARTRPHLVHNVRTHATPPKAPESCVAAPHSRINYASLSPARRANRALLAQACRARDALRERTNEVCVGVVGTMKGAARTWFGVFWGWVVWWCVEPKSWGSELGGSPKKPKSMSRHGPRLFPPADFSERPTFEDPQLTPPPPRKNPPHGLPSSLFAYMVCYTPSRPAPLGDAPPRSALLRALVPPRRALLAAPAARAFWRPSACVAGAPLELGTPVLALPASPDRLDACAGSAARSSAWRATKRAAPASFVVHRGGTRLLFIRRRVKTG